MLLFLKRLLGKDEILPCLQTGDCPYEYDCDSDRDVEGMPFIEGDERSCPDYGHICPKFMEDFGLTVEDLNIRAVIHCGDVMKELVKSGEEDPEAIECKILMEEYEKLINTYPQESYPQYY